MFRSGVQVFSVSGVQGPISVGANSKTLLLNLGLEWATRAPRHPMEGPRDPGQKSPKRLEGGGGGGGSTNPLIPRRLPAALGSQHRLMTGHLMLPASPTLANRTFQTKFGQHQLWPAPTWSDFVFFGVEACPGRVGWGGGPWGSEGWGAQNFVLFSLPPQFSFFLPSWGSSRGILVVFEAPGPQMCTFGVLRRGGEVMLLRGGRRRGRGGGRRGRVGGGAANRFEPSTGLSRKIIPTNGAAVEILRVTIDSSSSLCNIARQQPSQRNRTPSTT